MGTVTKHFWLVADLPLWKMMEFVSWDDFPFPTEWKVIIHSMVPVTTNHISKGKLRGWLHHRTTNPVRSPAWLHAGLGSPSPPSAATFATSLAETLRRTQCGWTETKISCHWSLSMAMLYPEKVGFTANFVWLNYEQTYEMYMEFIWKHSSYENGNHMSPLMHPGWSWDGGIYTQQQRSYSGLSKTGTLRGALENRSFQHVDTNSMMTSNKTVVAMINNQTKKNAKDRTQEQRKKKNNEQEQEETTCKHRSRRRRKPKQKKEDKKKKQEEQMENNWTSFNWRTSFDNWKIRPTVLETMILLYTLSGNHWLETERMVCLEE